MFFPPIWGHEIDGNMEHRDVFSIKPSLVYEIDLDNFDLEWPSWEGQINTNVIFNLPLEILNANLLVYTLLQI